MPATAQAPMDTFDDSLTSTSTGSEHSFPAVHYREHVRIKKEEGDDDDSSHGASWAFLKQRSRLGLAGKSPIDAIHDAHKHHELLWSRIRLVLREPLCEFVGTLVMVMFGNASVAQVLLSGGLAAVTGNGNYQSINWCWGLGVMLGVYVAGESGGFLNPAVTLAFCVYRGLPFRRFPIYLLAQFLGGLVGAGVVYANYIQAIDNYAGVGVRNVPPMANATAQIFCTYPAEFLTKGGQFVSEFVAATLLILCIFALKDDSNRGAALGSADFFPICLLFLIFGLGAAFGFETGYALNLARDFGPRLMSYFVGYGSDVFSAGDYYFWVPIVGSFTGCLFGGFLYDVFIYTGPESPINSPYMGLPYLVRPDKFVRDRWAQRARDDPEVVYKRSAPARGFVSRGNSNIDSKV